MIVCISLFSFCYFFANQFVVAKPKQKKRGPTRQHLQESSCQHMSSVLQKVSGLLRHVAGIQDCCLQQVADFFAGASDGVLNSADKEKLKEIESLLAALNQYLEDVDGTIAKKLNALTAVLKK